MKTHRLIFGLQLTGAVLLIAAALLAAGQLAFGGARVQVLPAPQQSAPPEQFAFLPESKLSIAGTSNVRGFEGAVTTFSGSVSVDASSGETLAGVKGVELSVPVEALSFGNDAMENKVRKALKSDRYPTITYVLEDVTATPGPAAGRYTLDTRGVLSMAGVQKPITLAVDAQQTADGKLRFQGSTTLSLADFQVERPTALFGTLKVGDEVTVRFDVIAAAGAPQVVGR